MNALSLLLKNKSFWVAFLALAQTLVLRYLNVPDDVWLSIDGLLVVIIGIFTADDIGSKVVSGFHMALSEEFKKLAKK